MKRDRKISLAKKREMREEGRCPRCGSEIIPEGLYLNKQEHQITGLCHRCIYEKEYYDGE